MQITVSRIDQRDHSVETLADIYFTVTSRMISSSASSNGSLLLTWASRGFHRLQSRSCKCAWLDHLQSAAPLFRGRHRHELFWIFHQGLWLCGDRPPNDCALGEARSRFHNVNNGGKAKPNVGIKTQKGVVSRIHDLVFSLGHLQAACRQSCCTTVVNLTFLTFLSCCRCVGERQAGAMRNSIFGPG